MGLASLRALKRRGTIDRIVALTWDSPQIDGFVAPVAAMKDVELIRVPQPKAEGGRYQTGVIYQIRNLEAALAHVPDENTLIVKTRPDFIADVDFLEEKIVNFDAHCAPSDFTDKLGLKMPASPFSKKIWVPWADANTPFFYEDAFFMGLKKDVAQLANRKAEDYLGVLADKDCGWFAHVVRFAMPFLRDYPMFERYLREFRYLPNNPEYRVALLRALVSDPFLWHILIAHAYILATSFHVDCGEPGDLAFYPNISNAGADWSSLRTLTINPPYGHVGSWRARQNPGGIQSCVDRAYVRLMDDAWQHAIFTVPVLRDLKPETLRQTLRNIATYGSGRLGGIETAFYGHLAAVHVQNWQNRAA